MARQFILFNRNYNFQFRRPESTPTTHIRGCSLTAGRNALLQTVGIEWPAVTYAIPENNFSLHIKQRIKNYLNTQSSKIQWITFQTVTILLTLTATWPQSSQYRDYRPIPDGPTSYCKWVPAHIVCNTVILWSEFHRVSHTTWSIFAYRLLRKTIYLRGRFITRDQIPSQTVSYTRSDTIADSFLRRFRYPCGQFLTRDQMPSRTVSHTRLLSNFTQAW